MISVEGLKVEFGTKPLFSDANFVVNSRDRVALVGKNGAGKSTLLKILCGQQRPTAGVVNVKNDCRVGYLPQVMVLQDQTTVREEAQKAFADVSQMKERVERLEREMNERTDYESEDYMELVERYSTAHERYLMMGAESWEAELERTLTGYEGVLRRLAHENRAGEDTTGASRRVAVGRAYEPPGHRVDTMVGAVAGRMEWGGGVRVPRPRFYQ